jgi:hypothetical protein
MQAVSVSDKRARIFQLRSGNLYYNHIYVIYHYLNLKLCCNFSAVKLADQCLKDWQVRKLAGLQ